uniref:Ig-like domain-containing protein n=1 Tax=Taeniopygia guttata TaxID=59729 RepID=A0A674HF44_TAEGU
MWEGFQLQFHPDGTPEHPHWGEALRVWGVWEELQWDLRPHQLGGAGGAPPDLCPSECHFVNGTEKVRCLRRFTYNREQYAMLDSDAGPFPVCPKARPPLPSLSQFPTADPSVSLLSPNAPSVSISLVPSSSQPGPGRLLCSLVDFYPAHAQLRWFQGQQELSVAATDVVPNGDWTHQLLVLLETPARGELTSTCQVEHVSLEHPLSRNWGRGKEFGVLGEPLGGAGTNWEGVGESLVSTGRGGWGFGRAKKGFGRYWGGWDGVLGVLVDTGQEFGGAGCDWEGLE